MKALIIGTGPSLSEVAHLIPRFDGLIFGPNNTFLDFPLDVWHATDPTWNNHFGQVHGDFDKWHWSRAICTQYGYKYVEGVWMVDGVAYPRNQHERPPGPCGDMWMADKTRVSLNHCSTAVLLNLAVNQYECDEVVLIGHDFHYDGPQRHYFDGLSDVAGEYPAELRKHSQFIKNNGTDDLLAVYKRISETPGLPPIYNATPGSKLPWFEFRDFGDFLK